MPGRPDLRLDWCSHAAAKYAVEHWHYSRRMPQSKLARLGVWESGQFVGAVIFGVGANRSIGSPYGCLPTQVCELVRVALTAHQSPVSRMVAIALRLLSQAYPGLRLVVSYADTVQGHHGGIYQAGNWIYAGRASDHRVVLVQGRWMHRRAAFDMAGPGGGHPTRYLPGCHTYLMPLDAAMRAQIAPLAQPYPKRPCATSIPADAPADQAGEGGSTPIVALPVEA